MAEGYAFSEEELAVDESLGYPKAYVKLCGDRSAAQYRNGPPFTFTPYIPPPQEAMRATEFEEMFPIIDPKGKPTTKPKLFVSLLWKQLNHLGNAGFDPASIRVDPYGNVLYYHADSASPLAWDFDHWFPCSRGGLTVPSNLRILQWQVCKRKHNKLEYLVPWWDLQLGISINQFLSMFASSNSDFRHRAFYFLFSEGENEELNASQPVESHTFPQHFVESERKVGLAAAAIVISRREAYDRSSALKSLDINRWPRPSSSIIASSKSKQSFLKENEDPDMVSNPYQAIVMARNSLKQREETLKMQVEIQKLDNEVNELKLKNEEERISIQDLEMNLLKRRRRAEKSRRLAEAQNSYRTMLEKMIRDAMHQSVVYKEQLRLNQAATNALMARLEAQRAICDASEKELHKKFKLRDELEKQTRPQWEHTRKRSRIDNTSSEDQAENTVLCLPENKPCIHSHKELRVLLEEENKASASAAFLDGNEKEEEETEEYIRHHASGKESPDNNRSIVISDDVPIENKLQALKIKEEKRRSLSFPLLEQPELVEDEEHRRQRGKGNVEKWLQMLLENAHGGIELDSLNPTANEASPGDSLRKLNLISPCKEARFQIQESKSNEGVEKINELSQVQAVTDNTTQEDVDGKEARKKIEKDNPRKVGSSGRGIGSRYSIDKEVVETKEKSGNDRKLMRSESARTFRRIPSSPSIILGMKKGVDCIGKKPTVTDDDGGGVEDHARGSNYIRSTIKTIRKAVRI